MVISNSYVINYSKLWIFAYNCLLTKRDYFFNVSECTDAAFICLLVPVSFSAARLRIAYINFAK